jgi:murein DD-endopeptidase MepM/ murein hydrolase activator NlpD
LLIFSGFALGNNAGIETIDDLNSSKNEMIKSIRNDIKKSMFVIKSRMPVNDLPELKFYKYLIKKGDTFWSILARTSLDMDTLISVNTLSTARDIIHGKVIYIPNMRGTILEKSSVSDTAEFLNKMKIDTRYIKKANRTEDLNKDHLFIPCGKLTDLERSLFIGTGFMNPLEKGKRTSGFGIRKNPFDNRNYQFHSGVDIACPVSSNVYSAREGRVVFSGYEEGYGNLVILKHEYEYYSYYGHLKKSLVKPGDIIKRGEPIALSGNTGRTTGPHLHFEVRKQGKPVNPGLLLRKSGPGALSMN